jgi:hypothetical protein
MMKVFASVEALREYVAPDAKREKPRFTVRLLDILNFTMKNPEFRKVTGAF